MVQLKPSLKFHLNTPPPPPFWSKNEINTSAEHEFRTEVEVTNFKLFHPLSVIARLDVHQAQGTYVKSVLTFFFIYFHQYIHCCVFSAIFSFWILFTKWTQFCLNITSAEINLFLRFYDEIGFKLLPLVFNFKIIF